MAQQIDAQKFVRVLDHALNRPEHFVRFNLDGLSDQQLDDVLKVCDTDESFKTGEVCESARRVKKRRLEAKARKARRAFLEAELEVEIEGEGAEMEL